MTLPLSFSITSQIHKTLYLARLGHGGEEFYLEIKLLLSSSVPFTKVTVIVNRLLSTTILTLSISIQLLVSNGS